MLQGNPSELGVTPSRRNAIEEIISAPYENTIERSPSTNTTFVTHDRTC